MGKPKKKTCTRCHECKDRSEFYRKAASKDGLCSHCKLCEKIRMAGQREKHGRKLSAAASAWNKAHPERVRERNREGNLKKYGLTPEQYDQMVEDQNGACAICGERPDYRLFVDHNHNTGKVRGLLCNPCNRGVGLLRDRADVLRDAAEYLEETDG